MQKRPLRVSLDVREPSVIELTVADKVQLDRLSLARHGYLAERHGNLLGPGVATLALDPGLYFFKTLSDANLRVVRGGVSAGIALDTKGGTPDPPSTGGGTSLPTPGGAGDEVPGELPSFIIE